ncbi:MAG: Various polyols ABC transporter, permease protein 1, partial [uncultured Nocardioidaceae bacterium]
DHHPPDRPHPAALLRSRAAHRHQGQGGEPPPPAPAAPRAAVRGRDDPAALRGDAGHLVHGVERAVPGRPRLRRSRQLRRGLHRSQPAQRGRRDDRAHRDGGGRQPAAGAGDRAAARPAVPRPRCGPHHDDRPVPDRAGRGCPAVEARAAQPQLRTVQRHPEVGLGTVRLGQPAAAGLAHPVPSAVGRGSPHLAVDALHDAHPAGRPAEPPARRRRGGTHGRSQQLADLPVPHVPAPAPLPGARRPARQHLRRAELRPRVHPDRWRAGHREPALHDLPDLLHRPRLRPGLGDRRRRRHRHDHHRHLRAASGVVTVRGGDPL